MSQRNRQYAEGEASKYLDLAEEKLNADRGKTFENLSERDKGIWMELLMHLNDVQDCLGDDLSDVTKKRISFIFGNYPEVDRTQDMIITGGAIATLDYLRGMSEAQWMEYYESYPDDENEMDSY
jgi:hypothetical protein